jgi:hypothetical protein
MKTKSYIFITFLIFWSGFTLFGQSGLTIRSGGNVTVNGNLNIININLGLVAYYPFNGNANDESGNGNNCTFSVPGPTLTTNRFGVANKAYYFDGISNYIQCNTFPLLDKTFTYAAWIKVTRSLGSEINNNFGCYGTSGGGVSTWDFAYNIDHYWFAIFDKTNDVTNFQATLNNSWKFVVVIYNGTTKSVYLDGQILDTPQNITTPVASMSTDFLRIGCHTNTISQQFMGSIDDIRIYNRSLTDSEILQLFHEGGWGK